MTDKAWIPLEQVGMDAEYHPIGSSDDEDYVRDAERALRVVNEVNNYRVVCIPHIDTKVI